MTSSLFTRYMYSACVYSKHVTRLSLFNYGLEQGTEAAIDGHDIANQSLLFTIYGVQGVIAIGQDHATSNSVSGGEEIEV